jgi:hypothetical protein
MDRRNQADWCWDDEDGFGRFSRPCASSSFRRCAKQGGAGAAVRFGASQPQRRGESSRSKDQIKRSDDVEVAK